MFRRLLRTPGPALLVLLAVGCRTENALVGEQPGAAGDTGPGDGRGEDDCGPTEIPYNGLDDDCDPETPDDDLDEDGVPLAEDCDDQDPAVHPGALEICNGIDDDCDGVIDPEVDWFTDADGDGWGGEGGADCAPPEGSIERGGDCDDDDDAVHPDATEVCNGIDDDCDGTVDGVAEGYGASIECPAIDCKDLLAVVPESVDGVFWIGEDSDAATDPFEALCDMATDGGGWTLILAMNASSMTQYDGAEVLENKQIVGVLGDANHLSEAFYRVEFTQSYLVDTVHGVPQIGQNTWAGGTIGDDIDTQLGGGPAASSVWSLGGRSGFLLRSTETTDGLFADGDLRVHFMVNSDDTSQLSFPVSTEYASGERHLVFDSDYGYAGGRIYTDPLYDVASAGLDVGFGVFVR